MPKYYSMGIVSYTKKYEYNTIYIVETIAPKPIFLGKYLQL